MRRDCAHLLVNLRHSAKGFLSLVTAALIVVGVMVYALAVTISPSARERQAGPGALAASDRAQAGNLELPERHIQVYITGKRITRPLMYRARIDVHGWKSRSEHIVDASIAQAKPIEQLSPTVSKAPQVTQEAEYSEMLRGQRVYATVDARVAQDLPSVGAAEVRMVVLPKGDTTSLVIDKVVEPAPKSARATAGIDPGASVTIAANRPVVKTLSRYYGSAGTTVTVTGSGFGKPQSKSWVTCAGAKAAIQYWSDTSIRFVVPSKMTEAGYVGVVVSGRVSNGLYFAPGRQPVLDSIEPRDAAPGDVVTLNGHNFGAKRGKGWVSISGTSARVVFWSDSTIKIVVPRNGTAGFVGVLTRGLSSNGRLFSPHGAPVVLSISKRPLLIGDSVTVTGRGFGSGGSVVFAGSRIVADSWSPTQVKFTVTEQMSAGYLGVLRSDGIVSNGVWAWPVPKVRTLSRWWAEPGDEVIIEGIGFGSAQGSRLAFVSGIPAEVLSWSTTKVTVRVPLSAKTGYVGVGTLSACSNGRYLVIQRKPHIDDVTTSFTSQGMRVVVKGTNFGPASATSKLLVAGKFECAIESWSDTYITAIVAEGASSGYLGVVKSGVSSNGVWLSAY